MDKRKINHPDTLTLNETIDRYFREEKGRDKGIYDYNNYRNCIMELFTDCGLKEEWTRLKEGRSYHLTKLEQELILEIIRESKNKLGLLKKTKSGKYRNVRPDGFVELVAKILKVFRERQFSEKDMQIIEYKLDTYLGKVLIDTSPAVRVVSGCVLALINHFKIDEYIFLGNLEKYVWMRNMENDFLNLAAKWHIIYTIMKRRRSEELEIKYRYALNANDALYKYTSQIYDILSKNQTTRKRCLTSLKHSLL